MKSPAGKRARAPRRSDHARAFHKDWERLSRSGRYDMHRLKEAMLLLIVLMTISGLNLRILGVNR